MIEMETIAVPKKALTHEVPLLRGALVIECNIPLSLLQRFVSQKRHEDTEFKSAKYSAITASPMLARQENFTLRQMLYPKPRQTEIILVLHISTHQDNESMGQTLGTLFSCIGYMCSRRCGEFGKNGWKKLLICIVVDGRRNMSWTSRRLLSLLGLFHGEVMVESVQEKAVEAHMFEYTTQVDLDHNKKPQTPIIPGKTPVQMLLCLKEESRGHHEANLWLSEAVLPTLQPHMLVFIPPGLVPHRDAVYRMWKKFDRNESCGGAVGQTISKALSPLDWLRYPFFAASALEQKLIHTFDKPVASCLGSAPVFPTTFSAFRYSKPDKTPEEKGSSSFCDDNIPMQTKHARTSPNLSNFQEYMPWLMEPFSQHQIRWTFGYARQSKAYIPIRATDESSPLHVPISMTGYIRTQRRQIQDKAVFIRQYLTHARQLITVKHSYFRKLGIVVLLLYFLIDLFISWFAIVSE
jgi:chitin synthase